MCSDLRAQDCEKMLGSGSQGIARAATAGSFASKLDAEVLASTTAASHLRIRAEGRPQAPDYRRALCLHWPCREFQRRRAKSNSDPNPGA
mmetsp:Transcript_31103/g.66897  ORF Transcript_31103/g.66897 Transcript_31103/m.66897 type:complete len:90 (+) Transcript_31103:901-1170(+)